MKRKRTYLLVKLILSLAVFSLIGLLVTETVLKRMQPDTTGWDTFITGSDNPVLGYQLASGADVMFEGIGIKLEPTRVKINSQGFRDREYPLDKPEKTKRILGIGDSYVFGFGIEEEETYLSVLERALGNLALPERYEVLNFGVPGYNTVQEVEVLRSKGLAYEPDIVILHVTPYDYEVAEDSQPDNALLKNIYEVARPLNEFSELSKRVIMKLEEKALTEMKEREQDERGARELWKRIEAPLTQLATLGKERGFEVVILCRTHHFFWESLRAFSERNGWYVHLLDESIGRHDAREVNLKDNHTNAFGNRIISEHLLTFLLESGLVPGTDRSSAPTS